MHGFIELLAHCSDITSGTLKSSVVEDKFLFLKLFLFLSSQKPFKLALSQRDIQDAIN